MTTDDITFVASDDGRRASVIAAPELVRVDRPGGDGHPPAERGRDLGDQDDVLSMS